MAQPSLQDFDNAFDPTNNANITGAQLRQLTTGQVPLAADKGIVVTTTDIAGVPQVPDANTNAKWQNYLWRRVATAQNLVILYIWNPNVVADPTYLNWQSAFQISLNANSLPGSVLQDGTVQDAKIASLAWGKLNGKPVVTGLPDPSAGNAFQVPRVKVDGSALEYANTGVIQRVIKQITGSPATTASFAGGGAAPIISAGTQVVSLNFTPLSANSIIKIKVFGYVGTAAGANNIQAALFFNGATNAVLTAEECITTINTKILMAFEYYVASPGVAAIPIQVRFASGAGATTTWYTSSSGTQWGGTVLSYIVVEEITGTLS